MQEDMKEQLQRAEPNGPRPLLVELAFAVRPYDVDAGGIVSNIVYVRWLEDLRMTILEEHLPFGEQLKDGYAPVVASTYIEYRRPVRMLDKPIGRMWLTNVGEKRWSVQAEIVCHGKVYTRAIQTGAFISLSDMKAIPPPEKLVKKFLELSKAE
jgi:acyl-CoA thioester hydrolase